MHKNLHVQLNTRDREKTAASGSQIPGAPAKSEWSVVRKVRLPHKVGLPLGSGGGGDDGGP